MIGPLRRTYVVVVRKTDELLCGRDKWVSRFAAPCICSLHSMDGWALRGADVQASWHGVLEIVWLHSDEAQQAGCLRGLEGCVRLRHPVTIRKALLMTGQWGGYEHCSTTQERSTLHLNGPGLGWLFATLLLQHPNRSQQAASGVRRVMLASCKVTQGVGGTWATCPTLLRGIWTRSRRAGFRCWSWLSAHA